MVAVLQGRVIRYYCRQIHTEEDFPKWYFLHVLFETNRNWVCLYSKW